MTPDGSLIIDGRVFRTQAQNHEAAGARLIDLLTRAAKRPKRRTATKPRPAAREKRLESKKLRSRLKETRGKPPVIG
jgi:ribosome-associated protein